MNRVVITGVGCITPLGNNYNEVVEAMFAGKSGISYSEVLNTNRARINYDIDAEFDNIDMSVTSRTARASWLAYQQAIKDSNTTVDGLYLGTGAGSADRAQEGVLEFHEKQRVRPNSLVSSMASGSASYIARKESITGPVFTHTAACASSSVSIGEAYKAIRYGEVDSMAVGGSECCVGPLVVQQWRMMRALGTESKPFSASRNGIILGEGSIFYILENRDRAIRRGAKIYGEIVGYGITCGSETITKPSEKGQMDAIKMALKNLDSNAVTYVNAHGTGTPIGDLVELSSINQVLPKGVPVSSTKAIHGHLLGASGAMEMIGCLGVLEQNKIIPNWGLTDPDPAIPPEIFLPTEIVEKKQQIVLNNSFAFGGTNVVLALTNNEN